MNIEQEETSNPLPMTVSEPVGGWVALDLKEVWEYRELFYFFTWRDVKVRYKQTILGASWAILQPFATMVIFSLFFGNLADMPSDDIPYPIFSYAALVPWTFFASGLGRSTQSVVGNAGMMKKVYFPRLILPLANTLSGIVDFLLAFLVLLFMMVFYGIYPTWNIIWLPYLLLLAFVSALSVGLWLSALNTQFRDIGYIVPFIIRIWMFLTPIVYPSSLIPEQWKILYSLNPMAGVIEGFRWALLGTDTAPGSIIIVSSLVALILMISGAFYFKRMEKTFADVA